MTAMTSGYSQVMRALGMGGRDPRVTLKQSGPALPSQNLAMYEAATLGGGAGGAGTIVTERGNVRPVGPNDPIFSVPAGFTREP
jgi:hypothetical protein